MPSTVSSKGGGDFKPVPAGTHMAICTTVVNLGLQDSGRWGPKPQHYIAFEIPSERVEWEKDGEKHEGPALIGNKYTSSLSSKAILRKHLESWRGRAFTEQELAGFDLYNLLGVPCMISVTHNVTPEKTYANIGAIMGLPAGTQSPGQEGPTVKFDLMDDDAATVLPTLPEWMQNAVNAGIDLTNKQTENPAPQPQNNPAMDDFDDDIPF